MSVIVSINKKEEIQHPISAFPQYVQNIITHYSEAKGYPSEYFIQAIIGAASTALGRSVTLQAGAYTSIASVWCIILGKRGFVKSEPLDDAFKPLVDWQHGYFVKYKSDCDELEQYKAENPKAKTNPVPQPPKCLANDSTPEKLVIMLADNQKGIGMYYDEIAGFVGRFNRYNGGDDEKMFLSLFNGGTVIRDRMNTNTSVFAKKTFLSIIGTTQPGTLKEVFQNKVESGFFDRWLITQPNGFKKQYPNQFGINPLEEDKYRCIIENLLRLEYDENNLRVMKYSISSYSIVNDFQRWMVDEENSTESDDYRGILAKMEIYLHKFSLILQSIYYATTRDTDDLLSVSDESAIGAVTLCKYFIEESRKVRLISPVEALKDKWIDIYKSLPEHGVKFDRKQFIKICEAFGIKDRAADNFLKEHGLRSEESLLFKVAHGLYTKNLF